MSWLQLTQANTGVTIHVNMAQVVVIAPSKTGGSALLTTAVDKDSARIVPVKESPREVADLLDRLKICCREDLNGITLSREFPRPSAHRA